MIKSIEIKMHTMVNYERDQRNLSRLTLNKGLCYVARLHSLEQMHSNEIYHESPITGEVGDRVSGRNIWYKKLGENVATSPLLEMSHKGLMQSPGHRANILNKDFDTIGIGIEQNEKGQLFITQIFMESVIKININGYVLQLINSIDSLRIKHKLNPISYISLETLYEYGYSIINKVNTSIDNKFNNNLFTSIQNELISKKIPFKKIEMQLWSGFKNPYAKDQLKQILTPEINGLSFYFNQNKLSGSVASIMVFLVL